MEECFSLSVPSDKQEERVGPFEFDGQQFHVISTRSSKGEKKFYIIVEFVKPVKSMKIKITAKIVSSKTVTCNVTETINNTVFRLICKFSASFQDLQRANIIKSDTIDFKIAIQHANTSVIQQKKSKKIEIPQNQTQINFLSEVTDIHKSVQNNAYCGLINQSNTCHLNVALQMLFHIPQLRNSVLKSKSDDIQVNALQRLFFRMKYIDKVSSTENLTSCLGWNESDVSEMRDAEETLHTLIDILSRSVPESIRPIEGKNFLNGLDSTFYDVQLVVQNVDSIETSLAALEIGGYNFIRLPDVFIFHLRRIVYNVDKKQNWKVNDYFSYQPHLNVSGVDYELFQVIIHSGGPNSGHYTAYIRPGQDTEFFFFNDSKVSVADKNSVYDKNYGGKNENGRFKWSSAYLLVYVKSNSIVSVFNDIDDSEINPILFSELDKKFDSKEVEKQFFILSEETLINNALLSKPSLLSTTHRKSIFIEGDVTLSNLYHRICYEFQCDLHDIRLWSVGSGCKLSSSIPPDDKRKISELPKTLYVERMKSGEFSRDAQENEIILFVHFYFCNEKYPIQFISSHLIDKNKTMNDLFNLVKEEVNLKSEKYNFNAYLVGLTMILELKPEESIDQLNLSNGDIICFEIDQGIDFDHEFSIKSISESFIFIDDEHENHNFVDYYNDFKRRVKINISNNNFLFKSDVSLEFVKGEISKHFGVKTEEMNLVDSQDFSLPDEFHFCEGVSMSLKYETHSHDSFVCLFVFVPASKLYGSKHRIEIKKGSTFTDVLSKFINENIIDDGSIYRFLVIDRGIIVHICDLEDNIESHLKASTSFIRVERVPDSQVDIPREDFLRLCVGKVKSDNTYIISGEPFLVPFRCGTGSSLSRQVDRHYSSNNILYIVHGHECIRVNDDVNITSNDIIIVMHK